MIELVDAAAQLQLPYHRVHRMALIGSLDAVREDGHWYVTQDSVDRFGEQQSHAETRSPAS